MSSFHNDFALSAVAFFLSLSKENRENFFFISLNNFKSLWIRHNITFHLLSLPFLLETPPQQGSTCEYYAAVIVGRRDRWALRLCYKKPSASRGEDCIPPGPRWRFFLENPSQHSAGPNWWAASQRRTLCHTQGSFYIFSLPRICTSKLCKRCGRILKWQGGSRCQSTADTTGPDQRRSLLPACWSACVKWRTERTSFLLSGAVTWGTSHNMRKCRQTGRAG